MKKLLLIAGFVALATAKPETYREKEDFQYSRSSSDDGSKSGYYGAQRGNMGGNYEKAHNMDSLAQNQMSGLVRQVHGELGEGANTRTGDVFSAASSRGMYGQGRYDLSNLSGRNFQEGGSYGDSSGAASSSHSDYRGQSSSSSRRSSDHSSAFATRNSKSSGYGVSENSLQTGDVDVSRLRHNSNYGADDETRSAYSSGHRSQSGHSAASEYEYNSGQHHNADNYYENDNRQRVTHYSPMKVILRPGTKTSIPFTAQTVDEDSKSHRFDENSVKGEGEAFDTNTNSQGNVDSHGKAKHYQSEFSYHKEWEKHDTKPMEIPLSIPTVSPLAHANYRGDQFEQDSSSDSTFKQNSRYKYGRAGSRQRVSSDYANYEDHSQSTSNTHAQNEFQYNQNRISSSSGRSKFDTHERNSDYRNSEDASAGHLKSSDYINKPKSYESSYSYHKSWERRGDPYVIIPGSETTSDGYVSQRLTDTSARHGSSHQYGSEQYKKSQRYSSTHDNEDCDEYGHSRAARSAKTEEKSTESLDQQNQNTWHNLENQQSENQWANIGDMGQQTQNGWGNLEDLGQQTQDGWSNYYNLGQQSQTGLGNLESFGQQTQDGSSNYHELGQQSQTGLGNLESFGQQTQDGSSNYHDLGQQSQTDLGSLESFGQQSQDHFSKSENLGPNLEQSNNKAHETLTTEKNKFSPNGWSQAEVRPLSVWDFNLNKTNNNMQHENQNVNKIKPVWETDADTQQINDWNYNNMHTSQNNYNNYYQSEHSQRRQQNSYNYNNQNVHSNSVSSLQSLWDKIDNENGGTHYSSHSYNSNDNNNAQQDYNKFSYNEHKISSGNTNEQDKQIQENSNIDATQNDTSSSSRKRLDLGHAEIGRGDIGAEDGISPFSSSTQKVLNTYFNTHTQKPFKTPREIESLSQFKETVLTSTEKNKLNENKPKESPQQLYVPNKHNQDDIQSKFTNTHSDTNEGSSIQHHKFHGNQFQSHDSFNQHTDENINQNSRQNQDQQFEDFGQQLENLGQRSENLDQQSQGTWDTYDRNGRLEDMGQVQTSLNPSENLMKDSQQTQTLINFEQEMQSKDQRGAVLEHDYKSGRSGKLEKEPTQKHDNIPQEKEPQQETVTTPPEIITKKPGFWKSVGSKFTNAKDKVSSWFSGR